MKFKIGDQVSKVGGDYRFDGEIRSVFTKTLKPGREPEIRIAVEDDRGVLFISNEKAYELRTQEGRKDG